MRPRAVLKLATVIIALAGFRPVQATPLPDLDGVWEPIEPQPTLHTLEGFMPPLLPDAKAVYERHIAARKAGDLSFDPVASCKPAGVPRQMDMGRFDILQEADRLVFGFEWNREIRMVDLNVGHDQQNIYAPTWFGFSTGTWQGATLLIDTVGFNTDTPLDAAGLPHSEALHIIERLQLILGGRELEIRTTIEDSKTFSRPWDIVRRYRRLPLRTEIREDVCLERLHKG